MSTRYFPLTLLDFDYSINYTLKLSIGSELYVAKRFFEIGSGREVTADENKANLEYELIRLKTAGWLLTKFKSLAKEYSIEHSSGILFLFHHDLS